MTEQTAPARDRLFALIASIPGSGSVDWCRPARALLDEIAAVPAGQAPATDQTAPAVWIDGHPQLEAIAATVWEHCRTEGTSLVVDDPRNIAVAALAAVLREAADELGRMDYDTDSNDYGYDTYRDAWNGGVMDGADLLRRLADETPAAPSAVVVRRATDETPDEAEVQLPFIHVDDDGDQLDIGAVMASTYDGEAPVVYVAAEQHQGDTMATVYVRPERVDEVIAALRSARLAAKTLPDTASVHIGNRANAEDCPACHGTNPPYPFICPGPDGDPS